MNTAESSDQILDRTARGAVERVKGYYEWRWHFTLSGIATKQPYKLKTIKLLESYTTYQRWELWPPVFHIRRQVFGFQAVDFQLDSTHFGCLGITSRRSTQGLIISSIFRP